MTESATRPSASAVYIGRAARRLVSIFIVALCVLTLSPLPAAVADDPGVIALKKTFSVRSNETQQEIRIPISRGLVPISVSGLLVFDAQNMTGIDAGGRVDILRNRRVTATFPKVPGEDAAPITFEVSPDDVVDGFLTFNWRYVTVDEDTGVCQPPNDGNVSFQECAGSRWWDPTIRQTPSPRFSVRQSGRSPSR